MFSKWEGGVGRRRLEFVDFAILVDFKFLFDWLSFELSYFQYIASLWTLFETSGINKILIETEFHSH